MGFTYMLKKTTILIIALIIWLESLITKENYQDFIKVPVVFSQQMREYVNKTLIPSPIPPIIVH